MFIIASMPLWVLSAIFLVGSFVPLFDGKKDKATDKIAMQLVMGLIYSTIFAVIAALVCRI
jgi:cellobiose-specific phosphotransferase system component IIC